MRAFVAITLPDAQRRTLATLQRALAESRADVKWVEPANLHLTLKFLGEIEEGQRRTVETFLQRVAARQEPFAMSLEELGAFPSPTAPRVIWVGVGQGRTEAAGLAEAIDQESVAIGVPKEERSFAAHITIGRVRSPRNRDALTRRLREATWHPPPPWRVAAVTLYQSVLSPQGPTYTVLAEAPLGAG